MIDAVDELNSNDLLIAQNFYVVVSQDSPILIARALCALKHVGLFTFKNINAIKRHANPKSICAILCKLHEMDRLTKVNLNQLLHLNDSYLLVYAANFIFPAIPYHLFTQAVFRQIIIRVQQANQRQLDQCLDQLLGRNNNIPIPPLLNNEQSTHTASIHQSVSESATKLLARYGATLEGVGLEDTLNKIKAYVEGLDNSSVKNKASKRCIKRVIDTNDIFIDPISKINFQELLALVFLAIQDDKNRLGDKEDAYLQFIEGLYEIQRGYNLSETGTDQGGADKPICMAGTFNKLIEKLQSIHLGCEARFITQKIASLKLPAVVHKIVIRYWNLKTLSHPKTAEAFLWFTSLVKRITTNFFEKNWSKIKEQVAECMLDEFSSLYPAGMKDPKFIGLIEAGEYTRLDLSRFQKRISHSAGYHQYCSQMLRHSAFFFSEDKYNRSESPKNDSSFNNEGECAEFVRSTY
ncbi:hypothetical protein [Rickettsiella endosymbiont of Dermanyssus gallinae]|uniref:hypothetical protein n=1 Tax=Rickettsiella endosymbiont of Dermanyssus gallinae TaxID=2856608 RepID=UPI001C5305DA|nr:hypothetical protein [Rickettsiella endosymbiont of Dermanyssus gallinae]